MGNNTSEEDGILAFLYISQIIGLLTGTQKAPTESSLDFYLKEIMSNVSYSREGINIFLEEYQNNKWNPDATN